VLGEESSIPLVSEERELVHGSPRRIGYELCRCCFPGPGDLRDVLHKIPSKIIFHVTDLCPAHGVTPVDVKGNCGWDRRAIGQRVNDVVVILDVDVTGPKRSFASSEVHRKCVLRNRDRPKQSAFGYPWIEIMDLQVLSGTCVYVQSYERKGSVVVLAVRADELAEHEANIRFERNVRGSLPKRRVCAHAPNSGPSNEPVEVRDRGGFNSGRRQEHMEQWPRRAEQLQSARYG